MKTIHLTDQTLRGQTALCFKEKLELMKLLDRLKLDVIELPETGADKGEQVTNKTLASVVSVSTVSADAGRTEESVARAWEAVRAAKHPALQVRMPVSAVQMEYMCHKKAPAVLEQIRTLVAKARYYCEEVEFTAEDATRAEPAVLADAIRAALESGASKITLCDTAGTMLPSELGAFVRAVQEAVPALAQAKLGVELSDELHMAVACAAAAVEGGVTFVKTMVTGTSAPALEDVSRLLAQRGASLDVCQNLRVTELSRAVKQIQWMVQSGKNEPSAFDAAVPADTANLCLNREDPIGEVVQAVRQLGYELSEEDNARVYEAFRQVADTKHFVGTKELEAIVASAALQVPSTYRMDSYVINCGNIITATANITLEKDGKPVRGVSVGDGPIDAAFLAIEQIIGHHYELDDFQIQSVTEGREAMGAALVKLRSGGRLYSGNGISTDIVGASIRAYVSALNKIVYEEG